MVAPIYHLYQPGVRVLFSSHLHSHLLCVAVLIIAILTEMGWYLSVVLICFSRMISGVEFEQAPAVGDGQGRLGCCSPWGHKELDMTERLNWTQWCWASCHMSVGPLYVFSGRHSVHSKSTLCGVVYSTGQKRESRSWESRPYEHKGTVLQ